MLRFDGTSQVEADTISYIAATSSRMVGRVGQLALDSLSTMVRAKVEADTISHTAAISPRMMGQEWQLALGSLSTMVRAMW